MSPGKWMIVNPKLKGGGERLDTDEVLAAVVQYNASGVGLIVPYLLKHRIVNLVVNDNHAERTIAVLEGPGATDNEEQP